MRILPKTLQDVDPSAKWTMVVFTLVGLLLFALSFIDALWGPVREYLRELGIVVLSVFAVSLWYELIMAEKSLKRFEAVMKQGDSHAATCARLGIEKIVPSRRDAFPLETLEAWLKQAVSIDLLGVSHTEILAQPSFIEALSSHLKKGGSCRILLLHPESPEVLRRQDIECETGNLRSLIEGSRDSVKKACSGTANISWNKIGRFYDYAPSCMIIRMDDVMIVALYVWRKAAQSPALLLRKVSGGLFEVYEEHFNSTWKALEHSRAPNCVSPNKPIQPTGETVVASDERPGARG
ncbi:MAG: hypothetical protein ACREV4_00340 [Gammaproteobacteria bacterium]